MGGAHDRREGQLIGWEWHMTEWEGQLLGWEGQLRKLVG